MIFFMIELRKFGTPRNQKASPLSIIIKGITIVQKVYTFNHHHFSHILRINYSSKEIEGSCFLVNEVILKFYQLKGKMKIGCISPFIQLVIIASKYLI